MIIKTVLIWDSVELILEVEDSWKWKEAKTAAEMRKIKEQKLSKWFNDHKSIRWRWLFLIITKLVDELYFKDAESWWLIVWIKKKIEVDKPNEER
jgi:hypothetical protein